MRSFLFWRVSAYVSAKDKGLWIWMEKGMALEHTKRQTAGDAAAGGGRARLAGRKTLPRSTPVDVSSRPYTTCHTVTADSRCTICSALIHCRSRSQAEHAA